MGAITGNDASVWRICRSQFPCGSTYGTEVTMPVQKGDLEAAKAGNNSKAPLSPTADKTRRQEIQGVFVISGDRAQFRKVDTGITGATDIEVTDGLNEGETIITGSYKVIRTLRNDAKIKVDNKVPVKTES
jgi:HlyD family secretion protein